MNGGVGGNRVEGGTCRAQCINGNCVDGRCQCRSGYQGEFCSEREYTLPLFDNNNRSATDPGVCFFFFLFFSQQFAGSRVRTRADVSGLTDAPASTDTPVVDARLTTEPGLVIRKSGTASAWLVFTGLYVRDSCAALRWARDGVIPASDVRRDWTASPATSKLTKGNAWVSQSSLSFVGSNF